MSEHTATKRYVLGLIAQGTRSVSYLESRGLRGIAEELEGEGAVVRRSGFFYLAPTSPPELCPCGEFQGRGHECSGARPPQGVR